MQQNDHLFDCHGFEARLAKMSESEFERLKGKGKGKGTGKKTWTPATKVGHILSSDFNCTINEETREILATQWQAIVTPVTGHRSYADMLKDFPVITTNALATSLEPQQRREQ